MNARKDAAAIDELVAPDFVLHRAVLGEVHGAEASEQSVHTFLTPCPHFKATIEEVLTAGDRVIAGVTYRGTDTNGLFGDPATGKAFTLTTIYIFRVADS